MDGATDGSTIPDIGMDETGLEVGLGDADGGASQDAPWDAIADGEADAVDGMTDAFPDGPTDAPSDVEDAWTDGPPFDAGAGPPACYFGDFETDGTHEVACLSFPGPARVVLDAPELSGAAIAASAVSPDGLEVAVAIRQAPGAPVRVVQSSTGGGNAGHILLAAPDPTRQVHRLSYSFDGTWLALIADFDVAGTKSLYVVPVGGGLTRRVTPEPDAGCDVTGMAWAGGSPGPSWLAFSGDVVTDGQVGLWTVDVASAPWEMEPVVDATPNSGSIQSDLAWDGDGRVLFRSRLDGDAHFTLHRGAHDGTMVELVPGTALSNGQGPANVGSFGVSPDGAKVAFSANSPEVSTYEVFVVGLNPGAGPPHRVSDLPLVTDPGSVAGPVFRTPIVWSPDGTWLAVVSDWRLAPSDVDDVYATFLLPSSGVAGGWRLLGTPLEAGHNARQLRFSAPGDALLVRGDLVEDGDFELFVVEDLVAADQEPGDVRFEGVPPQGDVLGISES